MLYHLLLVDYLKWKSILTSYTQLKQLWCVKLAYSHTEKKELNTATIPGPTAATGKQKAGVVSTL